MTIPKLEKEMLLSTERDGHVVLYRRKGARIDSAIWYRLSVPGIKHLRERKSTGSSDLVEATQLLVIAMTT